MQTLISAISLTLIACGASTTPIDGGIASNDAGALPADGGTTPASGKTGEVIINQALKTPLTTRTAQFRISSGTSGSVCTTAIEGDCTLVHCVARTDGGTLGSVRAQSAGLLSLSGAHFDGGSISEIGGFDGYGDSISAQTFAGGETLTLSATGAEVPAFTQTITAPATLSVTTPACEVSCPAIDRTKPYTFTWQASSSTGTLTILIGAASALSSDLLTCHPPQGAATFTLPQSALGLLPAGTAFLSVSNTSSKVFTAGDFAITWSVIHIGTQGPVPLQ